MEIFIDLDGPIIDVSEKYYRVYADILENNGFHVIPKDCYWALKRSKVAEEKILHLTDASRFYDCYKMQRKNLLESNYYLNHDKLQVGAVNILKKLFRSHKLILVTLRSNSQQLKYELKKLNIEKYFFSILTSNLDVKPRWIVKQHLIETFLYDKIDRNNVIIGDTETDILAGKKLGFNTVAILNGIRNRDLLEKSRPDFIINSLGDILSLDIINK